MMKLGITSQKAKKLNLKRIDVPPTSSTFWRPNGYPVDLSKLKADGSQFTGRESNVAPELLATVHQTKMDPPVLAKKGKLCHGGKTVGRWDRLLATHIPLVEDHDAIHPKPGDEFIQ